MFSLARFVSGSELKGIQSEFKGVQGERTEVKSACERVRQEQSKKRKRGLKERFVRTVDRAVCLSYQFYCVWRNLQGQGKN